MELPATKLLWSELVGGVTVPLKPSAAKALAFELFTLRALVLSFNVIWPVVALMVDGFVVPEIASILPSRVVMLSVIFTLLPVAPEATNVMTWPLTVMVSLTAKLDDSALAGAVPDSTVAPELTTAGEDRLVTTLPVLVPTAMLDRAVLAEIGPGVHPGNEDVFSAAAPVTVLSPNGVAGVPSTNGFALNADGSRPPSAISVPGVAVVLAGVCGKVGRLAAY